MTEPTAGPAPADGRALEAELASLNALLNSPNSMSARIAAMAAPSFIPFELPQPIPVEPPRPRRPIDLLSPEEIESRRTDLILIGQICEALENWEREVFFHIRGEVIARTKVRLFGEASPVPTTYDPSQSIAAPVSAETQAYWDEENREVAERAEARRPAAPDGADAPPAPREAVPAAAIAAPKPQAAQPAPPSLPPAPATKPEPPGEPGSQLLPADFYLLPAETRLTSPQLQAVRDRLLYLNLKKYDPNSLVDQVESLFTGGLNDPARVITDEERAEQALLLKLYKFNLFTPTPEAARLDAMEESPLAAVASEAADLAGADERQKDAAILLGEAVDGLAVAAGGPHAEPEATRFLNVETAERLSVMPKGMERYVDIVPQSEAQIPWGTANDPQGIAFENFLEPSLGAKADHELEIKGPTAEKSIDNEPPPDPAASQEKAVSTAPGSILYVKRPKILSDPRLTPEERAYVEKEFKIKRNAILRAAARGELKFTSPTSTVRLSALQQSYRNAVANRFQRRFGIPPDLSRLNADHPVDLVINGIPTQRLKLLDESINKSVGSALLQAARKVGLKSGDKIADIVFSQE